MTSTDNRIIKTVDLDEMVKCTECGWKGYRREAAFGHDDFYCPGCGLEGCLQPVKPLACGCRRGEFLCPEAVRLWNEATVCYRNMDYSGEELALKKYREHFGEV
jgi:hypothetical protein